jgi:rRNA biogenesis protein RRP5
VAGGFDWTGQDAASDAESDESSDEDEEAADATAAKARSKSKGKQRALDDLTSTAPDAKPESDTDFERALLASPNSSFLWIQYMSFQLQLHEIAKARQIGRTALEKINFREEEEKLNVWMALVNLEIGFGDDETREKVFKEAGEYNDKRTVFIRYAESLLAAGKENVSDVGSWYLLRETPAESCPSP